MIVMKFGGTSLADRQRLQQAARIVAAQRGAHLGSGADLPPPPKVLVVVSAMGETTDRLLAAGQAAERGERETVGVIVAELAQLHQGATDCPRTQEALAARVGELQQVLEGITLLREQTPRSRALLASFGERLCAPLLAAHLRELGLEAEAADARRLVVTDDRFDGATVQLAPTRRRVLERLAPRIDEGVVPVVTGFLGATPEGVTTTLGRGGSDYSATLLASLLGATEVWIWTDVDGILTADPRLVSEARTLTQVSYREAAEMSYFGAKVIHPRTMVPAMEAGIPIRIRNTLNPQHPGTLISEESPLLPGRVKTITAIPDLSLVTIDGRGMVGSVGVARRIFEATEASQTNVIMISQASSEQTVSIVVPEADAPRLVRALRERLAHELATGAVEAINTKEQIAVASIIGRGMAGTPGIAARLFSALAAVRVNVLAIAQGASELSISIATERREAERAVRAIHTNFGLTRVVHLVLVGCGRVGETFLRMLKQTRTSMDSKLGLELRLVGVAGSRRYLFDAAGIDPERAAERLQQAPSRPDDRQLIAGLLEQHFTELILVDATAAETTELHQRALEAGLHVVTANKRPLSGPLSAHRDLLDAARRTGRLYGYETTFGAGLPVLHTLDELILTGDALLSVSGCLSGTLGFICSRLQDGVPLQRAVAEAQEQGYTEPDPREDLSGRDVARKALIIARAAGIPLEPEDVTLEPLVPDLDQGLEAALARYSEPLARRLAEAAERGETLRYVAEISPEQVRVGLVAVPLQGPIGALRGPDNILVFRSRRYADYPLVVQGPGAGAEVTAAGVLGDVLKVVRR